MAHARLVSIVGGVSALALGVPPMLIGAIGASTSRSYKIIMNVITLISYVSFKYLYFVESLITDRAL